MIGVICNMAMRVAGPALGQLFVSTACKAAGMAAGSAAVAGVVHLVRRAAGDCAGNGRKTAARKRRK